MELTEQTEDEFTVETISNGLCVNSYRFSIKEILENQRLKELVEQGIKDSTIFSEAVKEKWEDSTYIPLDMAIKALQSILEQSKLQAPKI